MLVSVYLHKPIAETLKCYGDLSDVVTKIYNAAGDGIIDVMDKPDVPSRAGASRFDIDITSDYYYELLQTFPANSYRISVRRLLYWFVENEVYELLEWVPTFEYISVDKNRILKKIQSMHSICDKLFKALNTDEQAILRKVKNNLLELEEAVNNGR